MKRLGNLLNLLFPSKCPVCGSRSGNHLYNPFCMRCWEGIERYTGPACRICGIPTISVQATICAACLKTKPPFDRVLYYGIYDGVLKEAIHLLKFNRVKRLSEPLSFMLSELPIPRADGIIPVPLHHKRLHQREFNQTASISWHLSKKLGIPLMLDVLRKTKETPPQTDLIRKERLKNIKNVFRTYGEINGMDLLLIDDVITTGATIRECSKALIKAGARSVTVVALARSMPRP